MIWPFSVIRELRLDLEACNKALGTVARERVAAEEDARVLRDALEVEKTRRIAFETVASERKAEIDRILTQHAALREDFNRVTGERMKSLDTLNTKLMESKAPEQPPDMSQFSPVKKAGMQAVQNIRELHRSMDAALIAHFAKPRRVVNEPAGDPEAVGAD